MISSIVSSLGDQSSSFWDISREAIQYYSTLFAEDSPLARDEENIILDYIPAIVTNEINESLIRTISLDELERIVFQMKKGKTPRPNGFTVEFFQEFWETIKFDLLEVVQESHKNK